MRIAKFDEVGEIGCDARLVPTISSELKSPPVQRECWLVLDKLARTMVILSSQSLAMKAVPACSDLATVCIFLSLPPGAAG